MPLNLTDLDPSKRGVDKDCVDAWITLHYAAQDVVRAFGLQAADRDDLASRARDKAYDRAGRDGEIFEKGDIRGYVFIIAKHILIDDSRKLKKISFQSIGDHDPEDSRRVHSTDCELEDLLARMIGRLPEDEKDLISHRIFQRQEKRLWRETSQAMNIKYSRNLSPETWRQKFCRLMKKLRDSWIAEFGPIEEDEILSRFFGMDA